MADAKHTPGPWMQIPSVQSDQRCICTADGHRIDIARTYGIDLDIIGANARLIAAAPELLDALQDLLGLEPSNAADFPGDPEKYAAARAAISKATGVAA